MHTHLVSTHHSSCFHTEKLNVSPSQHNKYCVLFRKETVLLLLLDALRESPSLLSHSRRAEQFLHSVWNCLSPSISHNTSQKAQSVAGPNSAAPFRAMGSPDSSQHCFGESLIELGPVQIHLVRKVLMGTCKDYACGHFKLCI